MCLILIASISLLKKQIAEESSGFPFFKKNLLKTVFLEELHLPPFKIQLNTKYCRVLPFALPVQSFLCSIMQTNKHQMFQTLPHSNICSL